MPNNKTYIIAEAGVNHNGNLTMAKKLIDVASAAGASAVKFQTFRAEKIVVAGATKAAYQKKNTPAKQSQLEMLKKLELDEHAHRILLAHCRLRKIQFLSTAFDLASLDLLVHKLKLPLLKIASGEITNGPYLLAVAQTGKPVIMSTGMSNLQEIEEALAILAFGYLGKMEKPGSKNFQAAYRSLQGRRILRKKVTLLHCTTQYPAPFAEVNLRAMETMKNKFNLPVGLSDHTEGIAAPIAAAALGAAVIEKHFTLNRNLPGPDHQASLEPAELAAMISGIRQVEKALGDGRKKIMPAERKNLTIARRSIVAARAIKCGDVFSGDNLTIKRPAIGMSPMKYWELIGKKAKKNYDRDDFV